MNRYLSRKFMIAVASLVSSTWSLWERLIDASDYKAIVIAVLGLYGAANVAQKAMVKPDAAAQ